MPAAPKLLAARPFQGESFPGRWVRHSLTVAVGCLGLAWGISVLPRSEAADDFRDLESRLLRFESFSQKVSMRTLQAEVADSLDACDTHSQRAMLLMEMPLVQAALRSGAVDDFDRRVRALESRARLVLGCAPRESFVWLLLFDLQVLHGQLSPQSFELLAMSYETSPNEAWIAIRRIFVAMPLVLVAPRPVRDRILFEFSQLIRNGFEAEAARCYAAASGPIQSLLQIQLDQLDPARKTAFSNALQKLRS